MNASPTVDESFARLHSSGWSIGDTARVSADGLVWLVTGTRGVHTIRAAGRTQAEAWAQAVHLAEAAGLVEE